MQPSEGSDLTTFAVVLALALSGAVFAFSPRLLNLAPASIASDFLIAMALALLLWAVLGALDEVKTFGGVFQYEGWLDLVATLLLALPPVLLFGLAYVLALPSWAEMGIAGAGLLLCLPVCLGIGATLDAFLIRPRLRSGPPKAARKNATPRPGAMGLVGAVAALITFIVSNVANALTIVEQLFSGK